MTGPTATQITPIHEGFAVALYGDEIQLRNGGERGSQHYNYLTHEQADRLIEVLQWLRAQAPCFCGLEPLPGETHGPRACAGPAGRIADAVAARYKKSSS